ncbi:MAG: hypothetical protein AAF546_04825 [Verrucomicrobiota bacterium]
MKKILSIIFILIIIFGIGYAVYLNTGPIVHESLVLKGETLRVGNMTKRNVTEHQRDHKITLPDGEFLVFLEGYFPDPKKRINAENNYEIRVADSSGNEIKLERVRVKFANKEKKEGAQQVLSDIAPGKTSKRVMHLDSMVDRNLTITVDRKDCDTVANELYLRIRKKRV